MARKLRYVPEGGALVEVTCRTLHGILGRAQQLYSLQLINYVFASNHYHLLVWVEDAHRLALFVGYLNWNLAREVSRLTGWSGKIWERRYQAILISNEEGAQVERAVLADLFRAAAERTQVVVSTLSVTLVNQLSPEDIVVVDRESSESVFRRPSSADLANWMDGYALGELWEKNVLGGRPRS